MTRPKHRKQLGPRRAGAEEQGLEGWELEVWGPKRAETQKKWRGGGLKGGGGRPTCRSFHLFRLDFLFWWYPHDNVVGSRSCDECMKSSELICSLTKICQAYQVVPHTSISRQSVSIRLAVVQLIPVPPS